MKRALLSALLAGVISPALAAHAHAQSTAAPAVAVPPQAVPAEPGTGEQPLPGSQFVNVSELEGVDVYSAGGEKVGKIDEVVADADNRKFLVITDGGFFGLGKDRLAVSIERLEMRDGRLTIRELNQPNIDNIGGLRYDKDNYSRVESPQRVNIPISRSGG